MTPEDPRHGTPRGMWAHRYEGSEICEPCLEARRRYMRRTSKLRQMGRIVKVPIGGDRLGKLQRARAAGATYQDLADQLGVSLATVWRWCNSTEAAMIPTKYAALLDRFTAPLPVTGVGVLRRLQALVWLGYSAADLAERAGVCRETFWSALATGRTEWRVTTRDLVLDLWADLWDKPIWDRPYGTKYQRAAATRAHKWAVSNGWVSPLAWDCIDDATEKPAAQYQPRDAHRRKTEVDERVVERILTGERLDCTKSEKEEVTRRWVASGRSLRALEDLTGWRSGRYGKASDLLEEAS